jgi:hypothetical protein
MRPDRDHLIRLRLLPSANFHRGRARPGGHRHLPVATTGQIDPTMVPPQL